MEIKKGHTIHLMGEDVKEANMKASYNDESTKQRGLFDDKRWIAVDELIEFLKEFPAYHYSSLEKDRLMADEITGKMIKALSNTTDSAES